MRVRALFTVLLMALLLLLALRTPAFQGRSAREEAPERAPAAGSTSTPPPPSLAPAAGARPPVEQPGPARPQAASASAQVAEDSVVVRLAAAHLDASALGRARLYRVPHGQLGLEERYPSFLSPRDKEPGVFDVPRSQLAGHHLAVDAPASLSAWIDGDDVGAEEEVELPCAAAPTTRLTVYGVPDDRRKDVKVLARSLPTPGRPCHPVPGPDAHRALPWRPLSLDEENRLSTRFCTRAPIGLRVVLPGFACDPVELRVGPERGQVEAHLRPSARLIVAPQGIRGSGYFRLRVRRAVPPHDLAYGPVSANEDQPARGYQQVVGTDLGPGAYTVQIEADLYRPLELAFEVTRPGETIRLEPRMESRMPLGAVHIQALLPAHLLIEDPKHVGLFHVKVRRAGSVEWTSRFDEQEQWRQHRVTLAPVPVGTYDLLVWERLQEHVALVRDVVVRADQTTQLQVPLEPGRNFALTPLAERGLQAHFRERIGLRLRSEGVGSLPLYMSGFTSESMIDRLGGYERATVGPFPVEKVVASFRQGDERVTVELPDAATPYLPAWARGEEAEEEPGAGGAPSKR